ncbi:DNA-binding protein [Azomonas macrocytogenes]|nr:DNA-binding protein [Azomonas macrocytogenes]
MARGGINKVLVKKARQAILARGEKPSIDAIRIELGNTGSKTTIHRYLKELDAIDGRESPTLPLSEQLANLVAHLAETLEQEAQESVAQEREKLTQERTGYENKLCLAQERIGQLEKQSDTVSHELLEIRRLQEKTQEQLHGTDLERARLQQLVEEQKTRLSEKDTQILSLEEKHEHARAALEHYRQASKEQREQEQRRHETQIQQLQMDIRQLQQATIVKQDELTRLNRDNERLLTEARQLSSERQEQQRQMERQQLEIAGLNTRIAQSQGTKEALESRLKTLQADIAHFSEAVGAKSVLEKQVLGLEEAVARANKTLQKQADQLQVAHEDLAKTAHALDELKRAKDNPPALPGAI